MLAVVLCTAPTVRVYGRVFVLRRGCIEYRGKGVVSLIGLRAVDLITVCTHLTTVEQLARVC